jgi:hypothetical protein
MNRCECHCIISLKRELFGSVEFLDLFFNQINALNYILLYFSFTMAPSWLISMQSIMHGIRIKTILRLFLHKPNLNHSNNTIRKLDINQKR